MASSTGDSVRYVMILEIEKITTQISSVYDSNLKRNVNVESSSKKTTVARVVIGDSDLNRLIERGGKHLALVQDEEMEVK